MPHRKKKCLNLKITQASHLDVPSTPADIMAEISALRCEILASMHNEIAEVFIGWITICFEKCLLINY